MHRIREAWEEDNLVNGCRSGCRRIPRSKRRFEITERFLTRAEVEECCGIKRMSVYRMLNAGTFPRPFKIGRASRRPESEIQSCMAAKMEEQSPVVGVRSSSCGHKLGARLGQEHSGGRYGLESCRDEYRKSESKGYS